MAELARYFAAFEGVRYGEYLKQRYRTILAYWGLVCIIIGLIILSPLLLLTVTVYRSEASIAVAFLIPGLILVVGGGVLWRWLRPEQASLTYQEGAVIVVLAWATAIAVGTIPFLVALDLTWIQALFESTSGWTTTGLSVVDVLQAPRLILFYRSVTQLAGGAGLAIIALSALAGPIGPGISTAEGREQLVPHVQRSAALVLSMYAGYIVVGVIAFYVAGMNGFDAVNHAFAALSTGGFSTRPESIGYWDSPVIEAVAIGLMFLGTLNFLTAYTLLHKNWWAVLRNGEIHLMALLVPVCASSLFLVVSSGLYPTLGKSARVAVFETFTALSTTGFNTVDYHPWPGFGWLVLIVLMLIGGGAGSTAGAIKQFRIYVLYRALLWEVRRVFLPRHAISEPDIWIGGTRQFISDAHVRKVALFVFLYLVTFFLGSAIIAAHGYSLQESLFEFASSIGTIGLSVGVTSADAPAGVFWTQILGMILGRLEFFTVIVGITKLFTDARDLLGGRY